MASNWHLPLFLVNPKCNIKIKKRNVMELTVCETWNDWEYEELNKVKHLCAHMDISIKLMGSEPVQHWRTLILYYYEFSHSLKVQ